MLMKGDGFEIYECNEVSYLKKIASLQFVESMYQYEMLVYKETIVDKNIKESVRYLKIAEDTIIIYALLMKSSENEEVDMNKSLHYFKILSNNNHPEAMFQYVMIIFIGAGFEQNVKDGILCKKMQLILVLQKK